MADFKRCVRGYTSTRKECKDLRDDGYSSCTKWGQNCKSWAKRCIVSWIPIIGPMICKVFEWICQLSEWICTAAVWVVVMVCHGWKLIHTFICLAWEALGWVLTIPAVFIKLIFAIPIIGAAIKEIIHLITGIVIGIVGGVLEGIGCGLLGICPAKHMRLCVIITRTDGGAPVCTPAEIQPVVDRAVQIFRDRANIHVTAYINDGKDGPFIRGSVRCNGGAWLDDLSGVGMAFELAQTRNCVAGAWASILGVSSPLYAYVVRNVVGKNGCSLWLMSDYLVFEAPATAACFDNSYLAHEMGHSCGLPHASSKSNLMFPSCPKTASDPNRDRLTGPQKSVIRGSKYVQYF